MAYPTRALRRGDPREALVKRLQRRLTAVGCGPLHPDGIFGRETQSAVRLYQTRRGLLADGVIGPLTWDELYGERPAAPRKPPSRLLVAALDVAAAQEGVREAARNRGPEVDRYVLSLGLDPEVGHPWCQAFVYWCFEQAAARARVANPCVRTAGVLKHWDAAPARARVYAEAALDRPALIRPGAVFIVDHGSGRGHTGLVARVASGEVHTVEGNTNARGSREGDGVYRKTRSIASINIGFIDYAR
jgi:peptidoglycan hydrolase-like protein with peptidoglycan-binding domain